MTKKIGNINYITDYSLLTLKVTLFNNYKKTVNKLKTYALLLLESKLFSSTNLFLAILNSKVWNRVIKSVITQSYNWKHILVELLVLYITKTNA